MPVNSHYVPQFILRNFYNSIEEKVQYANFEEQTVQTRNTKSVFSEKGYYPDELESDLCHKVEHAFANLFHNKLENSGSSITLSVDELFLIKKYLIITNIRYRYEESPAEKALYEAIGRSNCKDFFGDINRILECNTIDSVMDIINRNPLEMLTPDGISDSYLWAETKDVLHDYLLFVKARGTEKFVIPDIGKAVYEGPMSRKKMYGLLELGLQGKTELLRISQMLSPRDYSVYPLGKNFAIISMSVFFKMFTESEVKANVILPPECPTLSSILGFGNRDIIAPPKVKFGRNGKEYKYTVKQLAISDVTHFNALMIAEAKNYLVFSDKNDIKKSVEIARGYTNKKIDFLLQ